MDRMVKQIDAENAEGNRAKEAVSKMERDNMQGETGHGPTWQCSQTMGEQQVRVWMAGEDVDDK